MQPKDNSCKKNFHELVREGCINSSNIIEESQKCDYFQAIPPDRVRYHPDMNELEENSIKFCLLHEENHNKYPYFTALSFCISAIVCCILFMLILLFLIKTLFLVVCWLSLF